MSSTIGYYFCKNSRLYSFASVKIVLSALFILLINFLKFWDQLAVYDERSDNVLSRSTDLLS